jgi:hypothetical protein
MGLSSDQMRIASELGERLAAGDETSIEDIRAVMRPIIRAGDEKFGLDVMMQIMFGIVPPSVFEAMGQRRFASMHLRYVDRTRDRTELANIKKKLAPPTTWEREL